MSEENMQLKDIILEKFASLETTIKTVETNLKDKLDKIEALASTNSTKITALNGEVTTLKKENLILTSKVEYLEREQKKNNVIIYHLDEKEEKGWEGLKVFISNFAKHLLKIDLDFNRVDKMHRIGSKSSDTLISPRPLRICFSDSTAKWNFLSASRNLKGTRVSLSQDYTSKERSQRKELVKYKTLISSDGFGARIKGSKLLVDSEEYTLTELAEKFKGLEKRTYKKEDQTPAAKKKKKGATTA